MAAPIKKGLDYFPLHIDFFDDPKILIVEEKYGTKGSNIAARLLCWVYKEGYYIDWSEEMALVFAKRVGNGVTGALVSEIVSSLIKCKFFDENLYNKYSILTSKGIQYRWSLITKQLKRKCVIDFKYNLTTELIKVTTELTAVNTELTQADNELTQLEKELIRQRKGKGKGKVKVKVKEREEEAPPPPVFSREIKSESPGNILIGSFPEQYKILARNHGIQFDDIPEELIKFNKHHCASVFSDVNHLRNSWNLWCSKSFEKKQGFKGKNETIETKKPKVSHARSNYY